MLNEQQFEVLAALVHDVWARWMRYQFSKCDVTSLVEGLVIPEHLVDRWRRQMHTPYPELPEAEKASDREIATEYLRAVVAGMDRSRGSHGA